MNLDHPEIVLDYVSEVIAGAAVLESCARSLDLDTMPVRTNFILLGMRGADSPASVVNGLRRRGYLVKGPFGAECLSRWIRVTLGPPDLMERFGDALAQTVSSVRNGQEPD